MFYIPTKHDHLNRNQYNQKPVGSLLPQGKYYIDESMVVWRRCSFMTSLFHSPCKKYKFVSVPNPGTDSSFETTILKSDFNAGKFNFKGGSYNYVDTSVSTLGHVFADILPTYLYNGGRSPPNPLGGQPPTPPAREKSA